MGMVDPGKASYLPAPLCAADPYGLKPGEVSTGATIMGCIFDGGIVMGADTRVSTGRYVANRASRKVSQVHDRIFVCRSGSAADTQALTGFVKHHIAQHAVEICELPLVQSAANFFQIFAYGNKDML